MKLNEITQQSRRPQAQAQGRPRLVLGPGQDVGPRRQGRQGAHRHQGLWLRRRPDAAAHAHAQARLQQHLRQRFLGSESRPPAEGDRRQAPRRPATRSPKTCCARPAWSTRAATACACSARARSPPRSTSKWPAPRASARAKRSKRPAARVTTTFEEGLHATRRASRASARSAAPNAAEKRAARKAVERGYRGCGARIGRHGIRRYKLGAFSGAA